MVVPVKLVTLGNLSQDFTDDTGALGLGPAGYMEGANVSISIDLINMRTDFMSSEPHNANIYANEIYKTS